MIIEHQNCTKHKVTKKISILNYKLLNHKTTQLITNFLSPAIVLMEYTKMYTISEYWLKKTFSTIAVPTIHHRPKIGRNLAIR